MPLPECIFQGAVQHVDPDVEETLDSVPVPSHLLLLHLSFGVNLVDQALGRARSCFVGVGSGANRINEIHSVRISGQRGWTPSITRTSPSTPLRSDARLACWRNDAIGDSP